MPSRHRWSIALFVLAALAVAPAVVWAADRFSDVPDSSLFHSDIGWLATRGITVGCNPPENDAFCPSDPVTREQMAAFLRRFAQTQGGVAHHARDEGFVTVEPGGMVEVLALDVPSGNYVIDARAGLNNNSVASGRLLACDLRAGSTTQRIDGLFLAANNQPGDRQEATFSIVHTFEAAGRIVLECEAEAGFAGNVVEPVITAVSVAEIDSTALASSNAGLDPEG